MAVVADSHRSFLIPEQIVLQSARQEGGLMDRGFFFHRYKYSRFFFVCQPVGLEISEKVNASQGILTANDHVHIFQRGRQLLQLIK